MDSLITAAARALAAGDPLGALNRVALRDDASALALRGIAMAQLGDLDRAKTLLRRAARAFGPKAAVARARCQVAEAEVALASRDLGWPAKALDTARATLEAHGDRVNAAHARYLESRRLLLIGRIDEAESLLATLDPAPLPSATRALHALMVAGVAMRRLKTKTAHGALARAEDAASDAGIPALTAEVDSARRLLAAPAARRVGHDGERLLVLEEVEALLASQAFVVDACRLVGRLRKTLRTLAGVSATSRGFALHPKHACEVVVLALPVEDKHADLLALLADGESWSSSALALALGTSQRTVQRALDALADAGKAQSFGRGRARRWTTPSVPGFTTTLLLPAPLPND